jgi:hypothetical protein
MTQIAESCDAEMLQEQSEFWRIVASRRTKVTPGSDIAFEDALREATLTQQLSCFPTTGLAWADLASLSVSRSGWDQRSRRYIELSQRYAPHEGLALALRLKLLGGGVGEADERLREAYLRDLGTVLEFGSPQLAASTLQTLDELQRGWADERLQSLPEARREDIVRALEAITRSEVN